MRDRTLWKCAYCRKLWEKNRITKDHVPPKGVVGRNVNRLTVPCCESCRSGTSTSDEALKVLVGLGAFRTAECSEILADLLRVMNSQKTFWTKDLVAQMETHPPQDVFSASGEQLGVKHPISKKLYNLACESLVRTAVGLIFAGDSEFDSLLYDFSPFILDELNRDYWMEILEDVHPGMTNQISAGRGRFFARWGFSPEDPKTGIMHLNFYGGFNAMVLIFPKDYDHGEG